ncbi:MAG: hypothetical protein HYU35_02750 [Parcubacteria group bacterium]|nr:hypothetical protein [Parcubacteria group bacterium]
MKIYIAGKNIERARAVMNTLRKLGHRITFDWVGNIKNENDLTRKASYEREGIRDADVLIFLWEAEQESARYEAGMAMGLGKPIIVSGKKDAFFFRLPEVIKVQNDKEIPHILSTFSHF